MADNTVSFPGVTTTGAASSLAGAQFSRASSATYFDSTLTLQTADTDVLRPAYDPILGTPFTLIEPASTNWVRNPRGEGGGASGSTTLPTNWSMSNTGGITPTMVGTGIEDGIPYADIRWSGSSTGAFGLQFEATNGVPASIGQQWAVSVYIRLMAGTISSSVFNVGIYTYNSARAFVVGYAQNTANLPTNAPLKTQRYQGCATLVTAGIAYMSGPRVSLSLTPGTIDFTLRLGLPQAELLPYQTNLLPPACGGWVGASNTQSLFQPDPYGQSRALLVMDTAITGGHYVNVSTPNTPNNQTTTYSVYIKYAGRRYCYMQMVDNSITGNVIAVTVDFLTGTLINPTAVGTATIIAQTIAPVTDAVSPGWYRISLSGILSTTVDTTITCRLWTLNDAFLSSYIGTGVGFYFYAPQFQVGPLTDYIRTETTSPMLPPAGSPQVSSRQTDLTGNYNVVGDILDGVESTAIAGAIPLLVGIDGTTSATGVGSVGPNPCGMPIRGATGYGLVQDYATGMGQFTRASYAAYHDSNGVLQLAPPDVLRPGYDPVTGNYYGSLIEGASTNFIRNPTGLGAVVGSPGTMPTNWSIPSTGLTRQIVGTGVEDGIPYVDIRQFGTTTNALNHMIFETGTAIPAVAGQQWVVSVYVRLVAGSLSGIAGFCLLTYYNNSAGTAIVTMGTTSDGSPFPTNAPLRTQRYTMTSSPAPNASIVYHSGPGIRLQSLTIGNAYDFTLRIGLPQAELVSNDPINMISPVGPSWQQQAAPVTYWQPDCVGTSRAVYCTDTNANASHNYVNNSGGTMPANQQSTASIYVKDAGRRYVRLNIYDNSATANQYYTHFDLWNGTITLQGPLGAATYLGGGIIPIGGGWYRIWSSGILQTGIGTVQAFRVQPALTATATGYIGDGTTGLYFFRPLLQTGPLTDYISNEATSPILPFDAVYSGYQFSSSVYSPTTSLYRAPDTLGQYDAISQPLSGISAIGIAGAIPLLVLIPGVQSVSQIGTMRAQVGTPTIGVQSTAQGGNLANQTSASATGVQTASGIGLLTPRVDSPSLTGRSAAGQSGSVGTRVDDSPILTGNVATRQIGVLTTRVDDSLAVIGISAVGQRGALITGNDEPLTGISAIGQGGSPLIRNDEPLTGLSAIGQSTSLATRVDDLPTLTGTLAAAQVGALVTRVDDSLLVIGLSAVSQCGTLNTRNDEPLAGLSTGGQYGALNTRNDEPLTGISAIGQRGVLTTRNDEPLTGTLAIGQSGALITRNDEPLAGLSAISKSGTLTTRVDDLPTLTGNVAAGQIGLLTPRIDSSKLTGALVNVQVGTLTTRVDDFGALTGTVAVGQIVSLASRVDDDAAMVLASSVGVCQVGVPLARIDQPVSLTGTSATGQRGLLTTRNDEPLTGTSTLSQSGLLTTRVDYSLSLIGNVATGQIGALTTRVDDTLTLAGISAIGQSGSLTTRVDDTLTLIGNVGASQIGVLIPSRDAVLTGLSAVGKGGTLAMRVDAPLADISAIGESGSLTISADKSASLTGTLANGQSGLLLVRVDDWLYLTNVTAVSQRGALTTSVDDSGSLTGLSAIGQSGSLLVRVDDFPALIGTSAVGQSGSLLTRVDATASMLGASGIGRGGSLTTRVDASVSLTGALANGQNGLLLPGVNSVSLTGALVTGQSNSLTTRDDDMLTLTGTVATSQVKSLTIRLDDTLIGPSVVGQSGALTTRVDATASFDVSAIGQSGSLTATRVDASVLIIGAAIVGQSGAPPIRVDDSTSLTGVLANGQSNSLLIRVDDSVSLTGALVTGQSGSLSIRVDEPLAGISAVGQRGSLSIRVDESVSLTGNVAASQIVSLATRVNNDGTVTLLSNVTASQVGALATRVDDSGSLTGTSTVGQRGALTLRVDDSLIGVVAAGQTPSLTIRVDEPLIGIGGGWGRNAWSDAAWGDLGTGQIGSLTIGVDEPLISNIASSQVGLLTTRADNSVLIGVLANGQVGSLTTQVDDSVSLTGTLMSGQSKSLLFRVDESLTGISAAGQMGSLIARVDDKLTGISAVSQRGALTFRVDEPLGANVAACPVGSLMTRVDGFALTGTSAVGQRGSLTTRVDDTVALTGASAGGIANAVQPSALKGTPIFGVIGLGQAGLTMFTQRVTLTGLAATGNAGDSYFFARASSATYIDANGTMQLAGNNVLRSNYVGGVNQGWLLEGASNNLIQNANTGSIWSVTVSSDIAPLYGPASVWKMTSPGGDGGTFSYASITGISVAPSTVYTISVWVYHPIGYSDSPIKVDFDTTRGCTTLAAINSDPAITGQWQRIYRTVLVNNIDAAGNLVLRPVTVSIAGAISYTTCWQCEQSAILTSYIPTTGAVATRVADNLTGFPQTTLTVPAISATGAAGMLTTVTSQSTSLSGVATSGRVGAVQAPVQMTIAGRSSVANTGVMRLSIGGPLIAGVNGVASVGLSALSITSKISGIASTGQAAVVTFGNAKTVTPSGTAATGMGAALLSTFSVKIAGVSSSATLGSLSAPRQMPLVGVSTTTQIGTIQQSVRVALTGLAGSCKVGSPLISLFKSVSLVGVVSAASAGAPQGSGGDSALLPSVVAAGLAGRAPFTRLMITCPGARATGAAGSLQFTYLYVTQVGDEVVIIGTPNLVATQFGAEVAYSLVPAMVATQVGIEVVFLTSRSQVSVSVIT